MPNNDGFLSRASRSLFGTELPKEQWQIENYCYLPNIDIRDVADIRGMYMPACKCVGMVTVLCRSNCLTYTFTDDKYVIELVLPQKTYKIKLGSQEEKEGCITQFYAVR